MATVLSSGASGWRRWLHSFSLPTHCMVCGQWQSAAVCQNCLQRWHTQMVRCQRCAIVLRSPQTDICQLCEDEPPEFDRAIAAFDYVPPWSNLLSQFKFHERVALSDTLANLLAHAIQQRPHRVDLIVPVPLSTARLHERGHNQTWLIAQKLSQMLRTPARHDVLLRTRHTERLMTLDADDRRLHITGAFNVSAHSREAIQGRHIAVVDDVLTTGATLNEVTHTLQDAGARSISAWVLARTPAHR